jgi:hypothetical protein
MYLAIVFKRYWSDFETAYEYETEEEAMEFAARQDSSAVVVVPGNFDDMYLDRLGKPIAVYWCGEALMHTT